MRKSLCLLGLLISIPLFSQSFINEAKLWSNVSYGTEYGYSYESYYIKMTGDTVISEKQYTKVLRSNDSLHLRWALEGFIRENDTGTVYFLKRNGGFETMLYDFGIDENDSIEVQSGVYQWIYVDSIRIKPFGIYQEDRKHIYLSAIYKWINETWIEGVGSMYGVLTDLTFFGSIGENRDLVCFSENDSLKFLTPSFNTCFPIGIYNSVSNSHLPLPIIGIVTDKGICFKLKDSTLGDYTIIIFDMNGKVMKTGKVSGIESVYLDISDFTTGIYVYQIKNMGFIESGKFIVE
ncbi:MAG: T9SS type A sorting domain-containing protein [Bacteroidota bacterium]